MKRNAIFCASSKQGNTRIISKANYVCTPAPNRREVYDADVRYFNQKDLPNVRVFIVK